MAENRTPPRAIVSGPRQASTSLGMLSGDESASPPSRKRFSGSFRRHRKNDSGGFLLDPTFGAVSRASSVRHSDTEAERTKKSSPNGSAGRASKRRMEDLTSFAASNQAERISREDYGFPRTSNGSVNGSSSIPGGVDQISNGDAGYSRVTGMNGSAYAGAKTKPSPAKISTGNVADGSPKPRISLDQARTSADKIRAGSDRPALDSESANIVSMALNLSENRRRRLSGSSRQPYTALGSHKKTESVEVSEPKPKRQPATPEKRPGAFIPQPNQHENINHFSQATLARAQKVRDAFELSAEYHRLLQTLPAVNNASRVNPTMRVYNPLQVIRNRKFRPRQKVGTDPSSVWRDVDKVKAWVDSVERDLESGRSSLPAFPGEIIVSGPPSLGKRRRLDWNVSPVELFEDLSWMEQGRNKWMVEDRYGNKIFRGGRLEEIIRNEPNDKRPKDSIDSLDSAQLSSETSSDSGRRNIIRKVSPEERVMSEERFNRSESSADKSGSPKSGPRFIQPPTKRRVGSSQLERPFVAQKSANITRASTEATAERVSRFDRLSLINTDVRNNSTSVSRRGSDENNASGPEQGIDSRRSSFGNISDSKQQKGLGVRGADMRLNAALGLNRSPNSAPVSEGLRSVSSELMEPLRRVSNTRQFSFSERPDQDTFIADKREIARVRALLLSSGVRAREIALQSTSKDGDRIPTALVPVQRSREKLVAGKMLRRDIAQTSRGFKDCSRFESTSARELKQRLESMKVLVSVKLSNLVRDATDDADNLANEINTSNMLAIKQLNEDLNRTLRRRRKRSRWVRRAAFFSLEWILVGAMWWVWLIVMAVRIVRGTFVGLWTSVRWLLWL